MFAEVNGIRLYYEETGRGRPLLLVHGNGESHAIFSRAVPELAAAFQRPFIYERTAGWEGTGHTILYMRGNMRQCGDTALKLERI